MREVDKQHHGERPVRHRHPRKHDDRNRHGERHNGRVDVDLGIVAFNDGLDALGYDIDIVDDG